MSGHSKWHNIQKKKGAADSKRGQLFTKLSKNVSVAARDGADPEFNFSLRMAIDAAKAANMTKDKIQAAIDRGAGSGSGESLTEAVYEGFGPGGIAMLIQCLTDNKNRAVSEVRTVMSKNGGSVGGSGSVMWMFDRKGVVTILDLAQIKDRDHFELEVIEAGAEDIKSDRGILQVICEVKDLKIVLDKVEELGLKPEGAGIEYLAKDEVVIEDKGVKDQLENLLEKLEDLDDVDTVYMNEK
ncbi:YebC/PmpR family DNA-binding transcriptional regulator [Patescibacteria group bacterium]